MNTYSKYVPNVFLAKCEEKHEKGDVITIETRYGDEHDCIVFNYIDEKDGFYFYSIVREDGFNVQEWAKRKAERYQERAIKAAQKSEQYYNRSNKDADFLSMAEPIKVGHHSEKWHRKVLNEANNNMCKSIEYSNKAADNQSKANNWEKHTEDINLSMPESLDYYESKYKEAKDYHEGLKSGKYIREHSYSLTYAKKAVNEAKKKYDLAIKLWGDNEQ